MQGVDPLKSQDAFRLFEDDRVLVGARSVGKCRQHKIQHARSSPGTTFERATCSSPPRDAAIIINPVLSAGEPAHVLEDGLKINPAPALLIAVHPWPARLGEAPVESTEEKFRGGFAGEGALRPFT
jgi:hypothetical protein